MPKLKEVKTLESFNQILSDGQKQHVVNTLSNLRVYQLNTFPHHIHPNNTLYIKNASDDDFVPSLRLRSMAPFPLHLVTDVNEFVQHNIVLKLVQQKNQYITDIAKLTGNFKRSHKPAKGRTCKESQIYSIHLNNLIEMVQNDPDSYFFGCHNWYYTGGTLELMPVNDINFLFHVSGPNLNVFNSSRISMKQNELKIKHLDRVNLNSEDGSIFEVIKADDNHFVAARQRNHFTIFHLQDDSLQQTFNSNRNIPFLSGVFHRNSFFTIDAKRSVKSFDLVCNKGTGNMQLTAPQNNSYWCQLRRYNDQLIFADERKLKIYDSRLFGRKESKCMEINFDTLTEKCEDITCVRSDDLENNLYVTTTHNLFVLDIRYGTESSNQLSRYTHQLKTPPMIIDGSGGGATGTIANERVIALSGTFADDIVIAQHTKSKNNHKIRTNNIPQKIPCTIDIDSILNRNGFTKEIDSSQQLNRKINIGTRFYRNKSKLFLLTERSSGELFYQEIVNEDDLSDEQHADKTICNFEMPRNIKQMENNPKVTTVTNFRSLKNILKFNLPSVEETFDISSSRLNRWQQPISKLSTYKDMLSDDLLRVWQINDSVPATERVNISSWLNSSSAADLNDNVKRE